MSEEDVAVYRRRKTIGSSRDAPETRQRVIGGIGRRKVSSNNAIQGRIQQFMLNDALVEDGASMTAEESSDSSRLHSAINSPRVRRSSSNISSRSNSGSIAEIRVMRRSRSNSSASSSTESMSSIANTVGSSPTPPTPSTITAVSTTKSIATAVKLSSTTTTTKAPPSTASKPPLAITTKTPPLTAVKPPTSTATSINSTPLSTTTKIPSTTSTTRKTSSTSTCTKTSNDKSALKTSATASRSRLNPTTTQQQTTKTTLSPTPVSVNSTKAGTLQPSNLSISNYSGSASTSRVPDNTSNSNLNNTNNKYGAVNTPGRSRRVSVATTTGKEISQSNSLRQRSESTSSLGQGSLLKSKQKWENLATENEKQNEEKARTPSLYRRKFNSNEDTVDSSVPPAVTNDKNNNSNKKDNEPLSRNGILRGSRRFRSVEGSSTTPWSHEETKETVSKINTTKPTATTTTTATTTKAIITTATIAASKSATTTTLASVNSEIMTTSVKKTVSNENTIPAIAKRKTKEHSEINNVGNASRKASVEKSIPSGAKSPPPPVAPRKKMSPFHKTSTGIAQLQSQLEKDFDLPALDVTKESTSPSTSTSSKLQSLENTRMSLISRKTSKSQLESSSSASLRQQRERKDSKSTTTLSTSTKEELSTNKNNNNRLQDVNNNNNNDSSPSSSLLSSNTDIVSRYTGQEPDTKTDTKPDKKLVSPSPVASTTENSQKAERWSGNANTRITTNNNNDNGSNKKSSFDGFKTCDANECKNFTSRDEELRTKDRDGSETNETKMAIKNIDKVKSPIEVKNYSSLPEHNKHSNSSKIQAIDMLASRINETSVNDYDISKRITSHPQNLPESVPDKRSSDFESRHSNANYAGVESISNSIYAVKDFVDQSGLSQQKRQGDIFSKESSLHRRNKIAYVNEKSKLVFDPSFDTDDNTKHTNGINCDDNTAIVEKNLVDHNKYAKLLKQTTEHRDRSNTWTTTSDSDESIISDSDQSSEGKDKGASNLSLSNLKFEEKDKEPFERRRRLTKKRSKRSKTRPKVYMRSVQACSIDTSDGDILESNYTSDDFSTSRSRELSSAPESTICESDLNENYESLDVSLTNRNLNLSTVNENIKAHNQNNKILVGEGTIKNSKIAELKEANRKVLIYDGSMKSSSMTTISKPLHQQNLMSMSTSNMGGSRSEDEGSKLINLHKNKDERIGSVTSISKVRVIHSFNPAPFNPSKKRVSDHQQIQSPSYSEIPSTNNNSIKPIQSSPFSLSSSFNKQSQEEPIFDNRQSDEDVDKKMRLEKLKQGPFPDGEKPFQLTSKSQIPDEESKKTEEVLKSLPSSPYYLSERLVKDIHETNYEKNIQSKSTGNLAKISNHSYLEKDIDIETGFSPASSPFRLSKSQSYNESMDLHQQDNNAEFIAPPENFKDEDMQVSPATAKKITTRPPLSFTSKTFNSIDDNVGDEAFGDNSGNVLRRPSYLRAQDSEENPDDIPKVPPPPIDGDTQETGKVRKRPKRPVLPTISTTPMINGNESAKTVVESDDIRGKTLNFYWFIIYTYNI